MTIRHSIVVAGLIAGTAFTAAACSRSQGAATSRPEAADVRVTPIAVDTLSQPVTATGTLRPKEEVALSFKISGVVASVTVDEGTAVHAGDTLAKLDLREIDAAVARAQSVADKAERDVARVRRLQADSVATLSQLQDGETAADVARADLETARFNRRFAVIVAPAAGVILQRRVEPGELVAPGHTVLLLGSHGRGEVVRVALADRDVVRVRQGDPAAVRFDALAERRFAGRVSEVAPSADPATGTYMVEIALPDAAGLPSGLMAAVVIRPGRGRPTTVVPVEAILEADGEQATVFVLSADGRTAERRRVTLAFLAGDRVAVRDGLADAQAVITDGAAYLADGDAVRVRP